MERNEQIVLLVGDSGNGKSTIAIETLKELGESVSRRQVILDASNELTLLKSINVYIDSPPILDLKVAQQKFCEYIQKLPPDSVVLIDNASDWDMIQVLVLWSHRCIITAEEDFLEDDHSVIKVEPPSEHIAAQVVRHYRPTEDAASVERFLRLVGRKPKIIIDVLEMYRDNLYMSLDAMSDCVEYESTKLIQRAGRGKRSVHVLYRTYFEQLESSYNLAAVCLAMIAHIGQPSLIKQVGAKALEVLAVDYDLDPISEEAFIVAASALLDRHLVEITDDSIRAHDITLRIFREITKDYGPVIRKAAVRAYWNSSSKRTHQLAGTNLEAVFGYTRLSWITALNQLLLSCRSDEFLGWDAEATKTTFLDVSQGLLQLGWFDKYIYLTNRLYRRQLNFLTQNLGEKYLESEYLTLYEWGAISRQGFSIMAQRVIESGSSSEDVIHLMLLVGALARASYDFDQAREWMVRIFPKVFGLQDAGSHIYHWANLAARIIDRTGCTAEALEHYLVLFEDPSPKPIIASAEAFRRVTEYAVRLDAQEVAEKWSSATIAIVEALDEESIHVRMAEANAYIAVGWRFRGLLLSDKSHAFVARSNLLNGAIGLYTAGYRRDALEVFQEVVALDEWISVTGTEQDLDEYRSRQSGPNYDFLLRSMSELDEPHSANRYSLLLEISNIIRNGPGEEALDRIFFMANHAHNDYKDERTATQALAAEVVFGKQLGLEWPRIDHLFTQVRAMRGDENMSRTKFDLWLSGFEGQNAHRLLLM
ncbi:hypothetical protein NG2371_04171 [Nocardia gamkensis]|nr:hypothetical protein [Nocardia gamkensis]